MNLNEIKQLIKMVENANVSHLSIESEGSKVEIKKEFFAVQPANGGYSQAMQQSYSIPVAPVALAAEELKADEPKVDKNLVAIKSQMVGTFYASPSPEANVYVVEGSKVKSGEVVCIIEAMKLFNEIESEYTGTIHKVLVENASQVEYGQDLFLVRLGD